jgi:DNA-binding winged helix-turn-helix (wHTH) protein/TolB-like protein/Tfp pilus assembly protein PilF
MSRVINHFYEFGSLRLDITNRLLRRNGVEIPLQPRLIETLIALIENANAPVTRDSLISAVWGETAIEEGGLTRNISMLRRALGEEGQYIVTLPKRGYRFTAEVKESWEDVPDAPTCGRATEFVLERQANLLIRTEEEITDETPVPQSTEKATRAMPLLSRVGRVRWAVSAAVLLVVSVLGYLVATGSIGKLGSSKSMKTLAVLPFRNLAAPGDEEHLGIGVTDVLITRLSNLKAVTVRPTSAVLKYDQQDSLAAGRALGVDAVLEGSIQRVDNRLRVTARLVRVSDQSPLWSGQFDEAAKDLLAVEDGISEQLAEALALRLSEGEKATLAKRYTDNTDAYQLYVKGWYQWNKRNWAGMTDAEYYFRRAIEKDPNFALAYVGLADKMFTAQPVDREAYLAVNKAIELDPNLGEAYATLGFAKMFHGWQWQEAEEDFKRAIALSPGYGTAHQWYASLLAITGRVEEAKAEMRRALEIDPLSANFLADMGQMHYFAHEYEEAESYCRKALEVAPDFTFAHEYLFDIYVKTGRNEDAFEAFIKFNKTFNSDPKYANGAEAYEAALRAQYMQTGMNGLLRQQIDAGLRLDAAAACYHLTRYYALLGDQQKALPWLEKSIENKVFLISFVNADPIYDGLRSEPRYQEILRKMHLPVS